jgi:hypothetical protein
MEGEVVDSKEHSQIGCPKSQQCVDWLDELDAYTTGQWTPTSPQSPTVDPATLLYMAELADHLRECRACKLLLAAARERRERQRFALRDVLDEGEQEVPATVARIFAAIRREEEMTRSEEEKFGELEMLPLPLSPPFARQALAPTWRRVFTWVVAALVVLSSMATIGQFVLMRTVAHLQEIRQVVATAPVAAPAFATPAGVSLQTMTFWTSVLMKRTAVDESGNVTGTQMEHLDPTTKRSSSLFTNCCGTAMEIDGVSHNGHAITYHDFDGRTTRYYLFPNDLIYAGPGKGGNAIWSTDSSVLFINTPEGIVQVDARTHKGKVVWSKPEFSKLEFFYQDALYASVVRQGQKFLYRLDLASGKEQVVVAKASPAYSFWLSPTGDFIYYVSVANGGSELYQVDQDGSNLQLLRQDAVPIGYDSDQGLLVISSLKGIFQVVKIGDVSQDDQVVRAVADGASALCGASVQVSEGVVPICEQDIAMIPEYGSYLIFGAFYENEMVYRLWSVDLQKPEQQPTQLLELPGQAVAQVQLIGWDKLEV